MLEKDKNRQQFLGTLWKPYPEVPIDREGHFYGRVDQINAESLVVKNQNQTLSLKKDDMLQTEVACFGPSVPFPCLKNGDWVVWVGTKSSLFLLSPCLQQSPQRNRNPLQWSAFLKQVVTYFEKQGLSEVHTPFLVPSPGVDHHIDFLTVQATQTRRRWTLPTSPEIHLKKFLCQGLENIFEIKNCFRDDLPGEHHSVEFTMLEWYRAFSPLVDIAEDVKGLFNSLTGHSLKWQSLTVAEAFKKWTDFELTVTTQMEELRHWARALQIEVDDSDDWNDIFFRIFMDRIEPHLGVTGPLLLWHFPAQQASLSQINSEGWCERFEVYWQGVELANAYLEVNDPALNRQRFLAEMEKRKTKGVLTAELDEEFFQYLEQGMPPASGIALGLDRLYKIVNQ